MSARRTRRRLKEEKAKIERLNTRAGSGAATQTKGATTTRRTAAMRERNEAEGGSTGEHDS